MAIDETRFEEGRKAYEAGDFRAAAREFIAAAGDAAEGTAFALHQAGNALVRLRRFEDAVTVYSHALEDSAYDRQTALLVNLGTALRAAGRYDEALEAYERAAGDEDYEAPHKVHQGKAAALYEMGRLEEACSAYKAAALDGSNDDPGKALNNLGLCYMSLGRGSDAVEAYRAAINMTGYSGIARSQANLGLALTALGRHKEAVAAFRAAEAAGFELSEGLKQAYRTCLDVLSSGVADSEQVAESPGSMPAESSPDTGDTDFFTRTDEQMRVLDHEARKHAKRQSREGSSLGLRIGLIAAAAIVVIAAVAWAWMSGYGWPTHTGTVDSLLAAQQEGEAVDRYWVAVPAADVGKEMAKLPPNYTDYSVDGVEADAKTARVAVTVTLEKGAPLHYEITLAREGVGWKVSGVENDWRSTGGGS